MAGTWRIELLGGLRVQRLCGEDTAPALDRFPSRQAGALLAFLAYFPRPHAREELAEMLWPGHDPELSRRHLRVVLSSLRKSLEPLEQAGEKSLVVADRTSVRLAAGAVTTDVAAFEAALREALRATERAAQSKHLARAIEGYRGRLLPGFYQEWIVPESQRLEESYFVALRRLIAEMQRDGQMQNALHLARRGASLDPLREDVGRDLMRLYVATGRAALALRHYREMESALKSALDAPPSPQTRELLRRIQSQGEGPIPNSPAVSAPSPSVPSHAPTAPQPEPRRDEAADASAPGGAGLPPQWARFFGREAEIAAVRKLLHTGARLVTLSGTGGTGKTRLALEIARQIASEREEGHAQVWFVPLVDIEDASLIAGRIATAIRLPPDPPPSATPIAQALAKHSEPLLVLDNFEHLLPQGAALAQELLARVPQLRLLATSRRELGLVGEHPFSTPPMPVPPDDLADVLSPHALLLYSGAQMFEDRARAARPDFRVTRHNAAAIARLCARLEGLPLAIELCAARAASFPPARMLARMERRLDFLAEPSPTSSSPHPTLRAALSWSYALLWPELQQFFAHLSVFHGGCTPEAAAKVAGEPHAEHFLHQLRLASLASSREAGGQTRFFLLETVREFAGEHLPTPETHALKRRHAEFYRDLAASEHPHAMSAEASHRIAASKRIGPEQDNLRAALSWSLEHDPILALHLVQFCAPFWGAAALGHRLAAEEALDKAPEAPPGLVSSILGVASQQAQSRGDFARQRALSERRLALMRAHDNDLEAAWALFHLGHAAESLGDYGAAIGHFEQALASFHAWRHLGPQAGQNLAWTLNRLGICESLRGDMDAARAHFKACEEAFRHSGDLDGVAGTLAQLADIARMSGDLDEARRLFAESEQVQRELGDTRPHPWRRHQRAQLEWAQGDLAAARQGFERAARDFLAEGIVDGTLRVLCDLGCLAAQQGDATRALLLLGCEAAQSEKQCPLPPSYQEARERALEQARAALSPALFDTTLAQGRALAPQTALEMATQVSP
jgi:predicted ATPase/DNA-binding SARP family transcriptional activator